MHQGTPLFPGVPYGCLIQLPKPVSTIYQYLRPLYKSVHHKEAGIQTLPVASERCCHPQMLIAHHIHLSYGQYDFQFSHLAPHKLHDIPDTWLKISWTSTQNIVIP